MYCMHVWLNIYVANLHKCFNAIFSFAYTPSAARYLPPTTTSTTPSSIPPSSFPPLYLYIIIAVSAFLLVVGFVVTVCCCACYCVHKKKDTKEGTWISPNQRNGKINCHACLLQENDVMIVCFDTSSINGIFVLVLVM